MGFAERGHDQGKSGQIDALINNFGLELRAPQVSLGTADAVAQSSSDTQVVAFRCRIRSAQFF